MIFDRQIYNADRPETNIQKYVNKQKYFRICRGQQLQKFTDQFIFPTLATSLTVINDAQFDEKAHSNHNKVWTNFNHGILLLKLRRFFS